MSRKKELQNKLEDFQKSLDDLYEKQYGSEYSHHSDYQKYSDIASHISNIKNPKADSFNIIIDFYSFPYSINWKDYFNIFFNFHPNKENSILNFYRYCIDEIDKLRKVFEEISLPYLFLNETGESRFSKETDKKIVLDVIKNLNVNTYEQNIENKPFNIYHLLELKINLLEEIIRIKDAQSKKLITLRDNRKFEVLNGLKTYFNEDDHSYLENALDGNLLNDPIHFNSRQTYLIEFFRRLEYNNVIELDRPKLIKWLCENFTYLNHKKTEVKFKRDTVIAYLNETEKSKQPCKIKKEKRILSDKFPYLTKEEIRLKQTKNI